MKKSLLLIAASVLGLQGAVAAPVLPEAGKFYKVKHSSGLYLTRDGGAFKIAAEDAENDGQYFRFDDFDADQAYSLRTDNGLYLSSDNGWTSGLLSNPNYKLAEFNVAADGDNVLFKCIGKVAGSDCLGTDKTEDGSLVYTDKKGDKAEHKWTLEAAAEYEAPSLAVGEDKYPEYQLPEGDPRATAYEGYKLVFAEEFNGEGIQPSKDIWNYERGWMRNNEIQLYWSDPDNTWEENGFLVFNGRREEKESKRNPYYDKRYGKKWYEMMEYLEWTSASIITKGSWDGNYSWQYGIYEVRAKVPAYTGMWPAIWSTGRQYSWPRGGEIDLMEWYGGKIHGNVCWNKGSWNSKTVDYATLNREDPNTEWGDEWHIWKMVWDYDHMEMWCDNVLVNNIDLNTTVNDDFGGENDGSNVNPFREVRQVLWLNLAIGGNNGGNVANCPDDNYYLVDYARVYQKIGSDGKAVYHVEDYAPDATKTVPENNPRQSGVNSVIADNSENAVTEYYNLQGMRIENPRAGQMVVMRKGGKAEKILF